MLADSRIEFEGDFQKKLFCDIRESYKNKDSWWLEDVAIVLNLKAPSNIYMLKNEQLRLSSKQLELLLNAFPHLNQLNPEKHIKRIESYEQWHSRAGKKGGLIGGPKNIERLKSIAKKAGGTTLKKYGIEHFRNIAKIGASNGGLAVAEKQKPTKQMRKLISLNSSLNIHFKINHTISTNSEKKNVDFVYFRDRDIAFLEEATETMPYRKIFYAKALGIFELKNNTHYPVIFTFSLKKKEKDKNVTIDVPGEALLTLHQNGILLVPFKEDWLVHRKRLITALVNSDKAYINKYRSMIFKLIKKQLAYKFVRKTSLAKTEINRKETDTEKYVHKKLRQMRLYPNGKHLITDNKYKIHLTVDNYFEYNSKEWHVLISSTETNKASIFNGILKSLAGQCFMIKKFFNPNAKLISIIIPKNYKPLNDIGFSKWSRYLKKYSDIVLTEDNLNELPTLLEKQDSQ